MGSGRESFLGTVSRTYPVMFVGGLKPIRLRPGRDVLKSAPNSWLCLTLAPELSKPFNFDPMHVEGTPSTRHPIAVSAEIGPSINHLTKFQGGSQHNFSERSPPVALVKTIALTPHRSPTPCEGCLISLPLQVGGYSPRNPRAQWNPCSLHGSTVPE